MSASHNIALLERIEHVTTLRRSLWNAQFRPIPIYNHDNPRVDDPGKQPLGKGWQTDARCDPPICVSSRAVAYALNTGVLCDGLRAVDVDIDDPELAKSVYTLTMSLFGETIMRYRADSARVLLVYRAAEGTPEKRHIKSAVGKVEVLGRGNQFVAFGYHPKNGAELQWMPEAPGVTTTISDLPAITEDQLSDFFLQARNLIGPDLSPAGSSSTGQRERITPSAEAALLANIHTTADYHESSMRLLGYWSRTGVPHDGARRQLAEAFDAVPETDRDDRWKQRRADIDRSLSYVYEKDAKARDAAENGIFRRAFMQDNIAPDEDAAPPLGERYKHLTLLSPSDCAVSPSRGYVVKGLIAPGDVAICFGHPGSGKSIIAPHIAYGIAQGREVFRRKVREGLVFYVPAEDPHGMRQRIHALQIEHGDVSENFRIIEGVGNLLGEDSADRHALLGLVDEQRPALIVIDTIAAAFRGLRENDADHMAQVTGYARMLARNGTAVLLMHHSPKADDSTPRGHGNLAGDADMTIKLSIEASSGVCTGTLLKNRNGPSGTTMAFSIKAAKVGTDEDGDTLTAPLAVEMDSAPARPKKLTQNETTARRFLSDLIAVNGKPLPAGPLSPSLPCIPEEDWRAECESRRLSSCETKKDRTKIYARAVQGLQSKGVIGIRDGLVWLADAGKSA